MRVGRTIYVADLGSFSSTVDTNLTTNSDGLAEPPRLPVMLTIFGQGHGHRATPKDPRHYQL